MKKISIIVGVVLLAVFCGYRNTIRRTNKELSVATTCFGIECSDSIIVEESRLQIVECYYGHRSSPYLRARLKNGQFIVLVWPWRPVYDEHKLASQVNTLTKNGIDTVSVLPLWWALLLGCVFVFAGVANSLGVIHIISEEEWREKYDLLNLWTRIKKDWKSDEY